jgi:sialic acid synthase SpsE
MYLDPKSKLPSMTIGNRRVGYLEKPLIITEIGINHFGSFQKAMRLVDLAAESGAEIIKVQLHNASAEMSEHAKSVKPGNANVSIYEVINENSLDFVQEEKLRNYIFDHGLLYAATPFSREAVDFLKDQDADAIKIGSGEADHQPLIDLVCQLEKPIIMSTGMQSINSIAPSVDLIRTHKLPFALLHCTNLYPMPPKLARLEGIRELMKFYPDAVAGYSDHAEGNLVSYAALGIGAAIIERHFVESLEDSGPDVSASVDPRLLKELISSSTVIGSARGGSKYRSAEEEVTYNFARSSVISTRLIKAGDVFSWDNTWATRPGTGEIPVDMINSVIGKRSQKNLPANEQIKWADLCD